MSNPIRNVEGLTDSGFGNEQMNSAAPVHTFLDDVTRFRGHNLCPRRERPHTGSTPCFRHGRSTCFVSACAKELHSIVRVSAGSMRSSMNPHPAATYGEI